MKFVNYFYLFALNKSLDSLIQIKKADKYD